MSSGTPWLDDYIRRRSQRGIVGEDLLDLLRQDVQSQRYMLERKEEGVLVLEKRLEALWPGRLRAADYKLSKKHWSMQADIRELELTIEEMEQALARLEHNNMYRPTKSNQ